MATPDFVLELRRRIGTAPLPLVGVTAVVFRDEKVLLGRRADNGRLECVSGIVDPGEQPADAAVRECLEEAGVDVRATRLALVRALPRITYRNGDQVDYLDLVFRCEWVAGEPNPADGELTAVSWPDWSSSRTRRRSTCATSPSRSPRTIRPGSKAAGRAERQRRSRRISTRGMPPDTASVSAAFWNPALSNIALVPTYAIVRSTFLPRLSTG